MEPLRFRCAWFWTGLAWVFLLAGLSFVPPAYDLPAASLFPPGLSPALEADKYYHCLAFFALMLWFCQIYRRAQHHWVGLALLLFGGMIEFIQIAIPHRSGDWADFFADFAGILLGWLLARAGFSEILAALERKCLPLRFPGSLPV